MEFQAAVSFLQLPETPVGLVSGTAPSVLNQTKVKLSNTVPVLVSDFLEGQEGQTIFVVGDGQSTLVNGLTIQTNTGADKLLAVNAVHCFTKIDSTWRELAAAQASAQAPLTFDIPVGELHTQAGFGYELYPNTELWYKTVVNLVGFTEFRFFFIRRNHTTGSWNLRLEYSLNNSSWVTLGTSASFSSNGELISAYANIPAGALNATVYIRASLNCDTSSAPLRLTSLSLQVR